MSVDVGLWNSRKIGELKKDENLKFTDKTIIFNGNEIISWNDLSQDENYLHTLKATGSGELVQYLWDKYGIMFYLDSELDEHIFFLHDLDDEHYENAVTHVIAKHMAKYIEDTRLTDILNKTEEDYKFFKKDLE